MLLSTTTKLSRVPIQISVLGNVSKHAFSSTSIVRKERLVILGSGWGGYQLLRSVDKKRWGESVFYYAIRPLGCDMLFEDVTVVSPNGHFAFTPLLAGCAVGTLEFRCTLEPVCGL